MSTPRPYDVTVGIDESSSVVTGLADLTGQERRTLEKLEAEINKVKHVFNDTIAQLETEEKQFLEQFSDQYKKYLDLIELKNKDPDLVYNPSEQTIITQIGTKLQQHKTHVETCKSKYQLKLEELERNLQTKQIEIEKRRRERYQQYKEKSRKQIETESDVISKESEKDTIILDTQERKKKSKSLKKESEKALEDCIRDEISLLQRQIGELNRYLEDSTKKLKEEGITPKQKIHYRRNKVRAKKEKEIAQYRIQTRTDILNRKRAHLKYESDTSLSDGGISPLEQDLNYHRVVNLLDFKVKRNSKRLYKPNDIEEKQKTDKRVKYFESVLTDPKGAEAQIKEESI